MPVYVNQIFFYHYVFIVGQVNFVELLARGQVLNLKVYLSAPVVAYFCPQHARSFRHEISPVFWGDTFVPRVHPYIKYKEKGYRKGTTQNHCKMKVTNFSR